MKVHLGFFYMVRRGGSLELVFSSQDSFCLVSVLVVLFIYLFILPVWGPSCQYFSGLLGCNSTVWWVLWIFTIWTLGLERGRWINMLYMSNCIKWCIVDEGDDYSAKKSRWAHLCGLHLRGLNDWWLCRLDHSLNLKLTPWQLYNSHRRTTQWHLQKPKHNFKSTVYLSWQWHSV